MSRPKPAVDVGSLARAFTTRSIEILNGLQEHAVDEGVRARAAGMLLDHGWGKPKQRVQHVGTGEAGEHVVIVRTINEGTKAPKK